MPSLRAHRTDSLLAGTLSGMMRPRIASLLCAVVGSGLVLSAAGCASSDASNPSSSVTTQQAQCEKTGGRWQRESALCEKAQGGGY